MGKIRNFFPDIRIFFRFGYEFGFFFFPPVGYGYRFGKQISGEFGTIRELIRIYPVDYLNDDNTTPIHHVHQTQSSRSALPHRAH